MSGKPRVRFAPSPTGYLHIGGARTALFNWLYARRFGGTFVLRIEDTDRARSTEESIHAIVEGMRWLGLDWDEGPEVGGDHGPYLQTERLGIYQAHVDRLLAEGKAYRCYCTKESLDAQRKAAQAAGKQFRYPGTCRDRKDHPDLPYVVRIKMPTEGETTFVDRVRGPITTPHAALQDEVIMRMDGVPLYNLSVVIDDATMAIDLVARGDDHINNTARQILMYQALGFTVPEFAHLPMILGSDKARLSKRHGAVSVTWYRDAGYLPWALVNYLVRLGWSFDDKTEIFSREMLLQNFDFDRVGKTASVFNPDKLMWLNQQWMMETPDAELATLLAGQLGRMEVEAPVDDRLAGIAGALKSRTKTLEEMAQMARTYLVPGIPEYQAKAEKKFLTPETKAHLQAVKGELELHRKVDHEALEAWMRRYAEENGLGLGKVAQPIRVALTGGTVSPGLFETMGFIGYDEALRRLDAAIAHIP